VCTGASHRATSSSSLLGLAKPLAFYQLTSATSDWVMWIWLADDPIFSGGTSIVVLAITTHYMLGTAARAGDPRRIHGA
jgi:hypothetical protein